MGIERERMDPIQRPMFDVESDWELPAEFPDLSAAKRIAIDIETCDPDLKSKGPGVRREGYMVGLSVGVEDKNWYFPFKHSEGTQFNEASVLRWAKKELCRKNQPKVGANLLYDLDYLYAAGVPVKGPFLDIQVAEPLIDENRLSYSLDSLAKKYLDEGKEEDLLRQACKRRGWKGAPQAHIWALPPKLVGPYAEADVRQPLIIIEKQLKTLYEYGMMDLFKLESKLIPILLEMRQHGVKIDVPRLEILYDKMVKRLKTTTKELEKIAGHHVDIWAAESIAKVCNKLQLSYPKTAKTKKPSFTKLFFEHNLHPVIKLIADCRKLDKFIGTFLKGSLLNMLVKDRIHCQFNQLRSDNSGTVSGRFSSSNPNLQFIPERDSELGPMIRSLFIPEEGDMWGRADYSQVEIRILVHYAMGRGASDIVQQYNDDPHTDYHAWCAETAGISRKFAKTINFGLIYGMGAGKLGDTLGISASEARTFIQNYYSKLPFLKETTDTAARVAQTRGYVKTLLNRRRNFIFWEPANFDLSKKIDPSPHKKTIEDFVKQSGSFGVKRAGTYKAFNAVDQGSAADIMKKAMVDVYEAGINDVLGPTLITVHDELNNSIPRTKEGKEAFKEMVNIMEKTLPLKIPVIVDSELKKNWGEKLGK
jgi:DNA polymerase I-like protein with 3'-5' exonuclease and polymerase domains